MKLFATIFVGLLTALFLVAIGTGASWLEMENNGIPTGDVYLAGAILLAIMAGLVIFSIGAVRFMGEDNDH